jgi:rRNA-processing protein FCF1
VEIMVQQMQLRSISFDTSFLLNNDPIIDRIIDVIARDQIPCYITSTVASELEQLKIFGRVTEATFKTAMKRWKRSHATVIDFKNRLLSDALGQACRHSMQQHGVPADHVINDCNILVSTLKNGIDLFLSQDFHFTSAITTQVIHEIQHAACSEYSLMCGSTLYSIDSKTFVDAYSKGTIDLDILSAHLQRMKNTPPHNQKR